jgi:hypothetical protein
LTSYQRYCHFQGNVNESENPLPTITAITPWTNYGCSYICAVDRLQQLREDLWNRWWEAFGGLADLALADLPISPFLIRRITRHADSPPAGDVSKPASKGRLADMACRHVVNDTDWQGFNRYTHR